MTRIGMQVWFAAFVALVFAAGVATGVLIGPRLFGGPGPGLAPSLGAGPGPGQGFGPVEPGLMMPAPLVGRLAAELGLDAEQQKKLEAVLARRRERLLSFNREARDRFETEQRELRREIAEVLTPEQQRQFERWLDRPRRGGRRSATPRF
jgi:hypothetical protein